MTRSEARAYLAARRIRTLDALRRHVTEFRPQPPDPSLTFVVDLRPRRRPILRRTA